MKMYDELAGWFHLITAPEDYAEEAAEIVRLVEAKVPDARTLLELGSGGGNNASHLKARFDCTLTDLSEPMLAVSRGLNPECEHVQGDMRTLRLGRTFDAVLVHDAIAYMTTEADLRAALATVYEHLRPGGVAVLVPDCIRETLVAETRHGGHDGGGRSLRYLEWVHVSGPTASTGGRSSRAGRDSLTHVNPASGTPVELHIVSDSTGETAARLVLALEAQFPEQEFEEVRHPRVELVEDLALAVNRAKGRSAVIVYTLVKPELRDAMRQFCRSARVHYCDLLGHPIESIARVSGMAAKMKPGARPALNAAYFKRVEAMEFAVRYDDGVGSGLGEADIVLVGVSRTSKTPLSIYLGYLGHKTANVPIVKGIEPPKELFEIDATKVVGLTIDAERLGEIRSARVRSMGAKNRQYAELMEIYEELDVATNVHRRLGCPVIDVTELSVEETAMRIVRIVERRKADEAAPVA